MNTNKELKRVMLQKMFPIDGHTFPELRFDGFKEEWEQRKLGNLVNIKSGWSPSDFIEAEKYDGELYIKVDDLNYSTRGQSE